MKFSKKNFYLVISLSLFAFLFFAIVRAAWQEPAEDFPGGSPAAPLDTSSFEQTKSGSLTIGTANKITVEDGRVLFNAGGSPDGQIFWNGMKLMVREGTDVADLVPWKKFNDDIGGGIYFDSGRVGIGTTNPDPNVKLHVAGVIKHGGLIGGGTTHVLDNTALNTDSIGSDQNLWLDYNGPTGSENKNLTIKDWARVEVTPGTELCFGDPDNVCLTNWPSGGDGSVTLNQGPGIRLTPNPITGVGNIALNDSQIQGCTDSVTKKIIWDNTNQRLRCADDQGGSSGVARIIAGANITISPPAGTGDVTINATGGSGNITDVLAGTGISVTNPGGPQPTVSFISTGFTNCLNATEGKVYWDGTKLVCGRDETQGGENVLPDGVAGNTLRRGATGWIADSAIYIASDGTKVGIGTTSPGNYKLTVSNTTDPIFALARSGATNPVVFKQGEDSNFVLNVGNADRMIVTSGGNVGIGTNQVSDAKLVVAGQIKIADGTQGANKVLTSDTSGLATWRTPGESQWTTSGSNIYYNNGNVGIGIQTPGERLTVYAGNASVLHDPTRTGYEYTYDTTINGHQTPRCGCDTNSDIDDCGSPLINPNNLGSVCYDQTRTAGQNVAVSRKFIKTADNVVTGGSLNVSNILTIGNEGHPSGYKPLISLNASGNDNNYKILNDNGTLRFKNDDSQDKFILSQTGDITIPGNLTVQGTCTGCGGDGGTPGGSNGQVQFNSNGAFGGDANLFWDNANKRLGIGTTGPQSKLDVNGNIQISNATIPMGLMSEVGGTTPLLNFSVNFREPNKNTTYRGAAFRIDTRNAGPLFQWLTRAAGSTAENIPMVLTEAGNVGIGTTSPGEKLTVAGIIHSTTGGFKFPDGTVQVTAATGGGGGNVSGWIDSGIIVRLVTPSDAVAIGQDGSTDLVKLSAFKDGDNGTRFDINPFTINSTASSGVTFFRSINTTGEKSITMFAGNNTADRVNRFSVNGDNWFDGGQLGIRTRHPNATLHVAGSAMIDVSLNVGRLATLNGLSEGSFTLRPLGQGISEMRKLGDTNWVQWAEQGSWTKTTTPTDSCSGNNNTAIFICTGQNVVGPCFDQADLYGVNENGNPVNQGRHVREIQCRAESGNYTIKNSSNNLIFTDGGGQTRFTLGQGGALNIGPNRFVVNANGNVGIGTTDPQAKLQVAGDLYVGPNSNLKAGQGITLNTDGSGRPTCGSSRRGLIWFNYDTALDHISICVRVWGGAIYEYVWQNLDQRPD